MLWITSVSLTSFAMQHRYTHKTIKIPCTVFHSFLKLSFFKPDFQFICMKTYRCFGLQTMELKRGQQQIPQVRNPPWLSFPYIGIWNWFVIHFSSFSLTGCRHRCKQTELTFLPCLVCWSMSSGPGLMIVKLSIA